MRVVLPLIALLLATSANARELAQVQPGLPTVQVIGQSGATATCRDRIQEVRRELGQPTLERNSTPQDPLLIAAVDKRVGGCSVMVMRNDTSDVRPLPAPAEHRLMPAR